MSVFSKRLALYNAKTPAPTRAIFVAYDQLNGALFDLDRLDPSVAVVLVESPAKAALRPYHQQKLAIVLSATRHFALEVAAAGRRVIHVVAPGDYASALRQLAQRLGPLVGIEPA